jgi:hypothetical protein
LRCSESERFGDTMARSAMPPCFRYVSSRILLATPLLLVAATASAAPPGELVVSAANSAAAARTSATESPLPVFEMHSGFWVNLHHFLYLQTRLLKGNPSSNENDRGATAPNELPAPLIDFPAAEIRAWQDAVAFYSKDLANRDLLLNGDMEIINNQLSAMEACPELEGKASPSCKSGLRPDLVEALERAAPVYRTHWWPQHDRANREWIAAVAPLIEQMGVELSSRLADVYQRPWPSARMRVDVVWYAGPFGAYTSLDPTHITISSHDPRNQGLYGYEVLFHEASHAVAIGVSQAIAHQFHDRDKPIPRELWHALLFYTTGEMVRREVTYEGALPSNQQSSGSSEYQPYAARFGLYYGSWERFRSLLDLYWRPYLDGKVTFDTAIARLASAM